MFAPLSRAHASGTIRQWPGEENLDSRQARLRAQPISKLDRPSNERTPLLARVGIVGPSRERIDELLENWASRWLLLVGLPALAIVVWVSVPFSLRETDNDAADVRFWSLCVLSLGREARLTAQPGHLLFGLPAHRPVLGPEPLRAIPRRSASLGQVRRHPRVVPG